MGAFNFGTSYSKPGKGVDKNESEKKSFFVYWEVYFRRFSKIVLLNLIFILFCLPVFTIGPAICAMQKVMKDYVNGRGVFLFSDFWAAFKENFKFGFLFGVLDVVVFYFLWIAFAFYNTQRTTNTIFYALLILDLIFLILWIFISVYMWMMIPVLKQKFKPMFKNAFFMSILGVKSNVVVFFACILYLFINYFIFMTSAIGILIGTALFLVITPALVSYTIEFCCFPVIEKYIIDPYYKRTGERRPDEFNYDPLEDEVIFEDIGSSEMQTPEAMNAGKVKKIK